MIQQEMLQYQSLDGELNRIERDLKKNENYLKSRQYKALKQECDENLSKLDVKSADLRAQLVTARQSIEKITAVIEEHAKEINDIEDVDELNYMNKKLNEQLELLSAVDKEIKRILREGEDIAKSFDEISAKLPKLIAGFNKTSEEFKKATEAVKPRVAELRAKKAELEKVVDKALLDVYKKVSEGGKHPVFVPLRDGARCGGCQMEMPKAVVDAQFSGKSFIRCEHCGRVIYKED